MVSQAHLRWELRAITRPAVYGRRRTLPDADSVCVPRQVRPAIESFEQNDARAGGGETRYWPAVGAGSPQAAGLAGHR